MHTMTVWRQSAYGSADTVAPETVPAPEPGRGEVLVRTAAVSLNSGDIHLMRGEPGLVRMFAGRRGPRVRGRGMDVAGTLTPHLERTYPLAEAGAALAYVEAGHAVGKVVVTAS